MRLLTPPTTTCPGCGSIRPGAVGWVPVYGTAAHPGTFVPCTDSWHR